MTQSKIIQVDFSGGFSGNAEAEDIKILEDLRKLLKPLEDAELKALEDSLLEEGCRDALVTWNGYLLDGHNRLALCKKHGLKYRTAEKDFPNIHRAKIWMIKNQLGRRNIENFMKIALHDLIRIELEKEAKSRQGTRNDLKDSVKNFPLIPGESQKKRENETNRQLSKLTEIGHDTISKYNKIMATKDEELIADCMSGKKTINRAYQDIKSEEKSSEAEDIGFPTDKHYRFFYCDPYYQTFDKEGSGWGHKDSYRGVDIEDLPVKNVKFFEAKCFIWTPPYFLTSSLNLMKSWGFEYQTSLCWELKEPYESQTVIGEYLLVLIGTVGGSNRPIFKPNTLLRDNGQGSRHDQVRAYIDKMHPEGDRLEILGKHKKEGWDLFTHREEAV